MVGGIGDDFGRGQDAFEVIFGEVAAVSCVV